MLLVSQLRQQTEDAQRLIADENAFKQRQSLTK